MDSYTFLTTSFSPFIFSRANSKIDSIKKSSLTGLDFLFFHQPYGAGFSFFLQPYGAGCFFNLTGLTLIKLNLTKPSISNHEIHLYYAPAKRKDMPLKELALQL
jgi:hypothetical protein